MSIVTRGLGGGDLVTGGLGSEAADDPGSMSALLVGNGTVTATLSTSTNEPPPTVFIGGGGGRNVLPARPTRRRKSMSAWVVGGSTVHATATTTRREITGFDDLELLFALELV